MPRTWEIVTGISEAGGDSRVRRWEARRTLGARTESSYGSSKRSVRGGGDMSFPFSTRLLPISIEQSSRIYIPTDSPVTSRPAN